MFRVTTCYTSQLISTEHSKGALQCADSSIILHSQFCDGIIDCDDGSDEIRDQPGFKCSKCSLPQNNLYGEFAHCNDSSDLCFNNNSTGTCFECFDKRLLISFRQVCNGVIDCFDMSDECLCEESFFGTNIMCYSVFEQHNFQCFNNEKLKPLHNFNVSYAINMPTDTRDLFVRCETKSGSTLAIRCDGRPECRDFSDECEYTNPASFCTDPCRTFFPIGDRYCDGVEDQAWRYINDPACPQGFDELFCDKRFKCPAAGNVSIDDRQVCDGKADCDDQSDEEGCPGSPTRQTGFSSETEMIASPVIKSAFWIMGILVIFGNAYVIITKIALLF